MKTTFRLILMPFAVLRILVGLILFPEFAPQAWRNAKEAWKALRAKT
jgi:hypothetical protein